MRRLAGVGACVVCLLGCSGTQTPRQPRARVESPQDAWLLCQAGTSVEPVAEGLALLVEYRNELPLPYEWTALAVAVDGQCWHRWEAEPESDTARKLIAFDGLLKPGHHEVDVYVRYHVRASPWPGVTQATYVRAWRFELRSRRGLDLASPRLLRIVGEVQGSPVSLDERPRIRFEE